MRFRSEEGFTISEVTINLSITIVFFAGFMKTMDYINLHVREEFRISNLQGDIRSTARAIQRDLLKAGSNPRGAPFLFDASPAWDLPLNMDPDGDGDPSNGVSVRFDFRGDENPAMPDGDADDPGEEVGYIHDAPNETLIRFHRMGEERDDLVYMNGVEEFVVKYLDRQGVETRDPLAVSTIVIEMQVMVEGGGKGDPLPCTRRVTLRTRLPNR